MGDSKCAIVTGAASGIGYSIAKHLIKRHITVYALDKVSQDEFKDNSFLCDISEEQNVEQIADILKKKEINIDYLVLAAGVLCVNSRYMITDMKYEEWKGVLDANLSGTMFCLKHFLPLMNFGGAVVTFSSEQVVKPIKKSAPYLVSKAGIEVLTKLAALENIDKNLRINCIRAASVDTNFIASYVKEADIREKMRNEMDEKMPLGIISPDDIAHLSWMLLSEENTKITGQVITIDGGVLL